MNEQPSQTENDKFNKILSLVRCELETVRQEKLVEFLASKPNFARAVMIRKGREIMRKDLVGIEEGPNGFLTDIFHPVFAVTPSRRCIVVKEDLLCNGEGNCRRKCGGIGACIPDCPKKNERAKMGHRCSFKVLLTMHSDRIGTWEVKSIGSHIEPEDFWVPPVKKLRERKCQSKVLKLPRKSIKNKPVFSSPRNERPLKQQLNHHISSPRKKNTDLLMQEALFDRQPDLLEDNINTLTQQDNNGVQIIEPPIKEPPLEFQNTENIPNIHNQDNLLEFSQDGQQNLADFHQPVNYEYLPDGGGVSINNMNFMTDNIIEDNRCLEEQILDFHRLEHQQKMQYLAEEHQARMEVISIEKDIALFKRQKLMNEIYGSTKCDNISLTEH